MEKEFCKKFYFYANDNKDFQSSVFEYQEMKEEGHANLRFVYLFDEKDLLDDNIFVKVNNVIKEAKNKGIKETDLTISFMHQVDVDNNKTYNKLVKLTNKFTNIKLGIEDGSITWSLEEIYNSNKQINEIVEEIKSKNLTPLETLMYAYFEVTNRIYKDIEKGENKFLSRTTYGVLNTDKIVCVGYCELFYDIITKLGLTNVKVFKNNVATEIINEEYNLHRNLIIYVKDKKYNIDGFYYTDPTWDATHKQDQEYRLNFFMLSLNELSTINGYIICRDKVNYSGIKYDNGIDGSMLYRNLPEKDDKVSFYLNGALFNEEFVNFILKDENYKNFFKNTIKGISSKEEEFKNNNCNIVKKIDKKSKKINIDIIYKVLRNVLRQKFNNLTEKEIDNKIIEIFKTNYKMNKIAFEYKANSNFSQSNYEKYYNLDKNM